MLARRLIVAAALVGLSLPVAATAAQPEPPPKAQEFDYEREEITTKYLGPEMSVVHGLPRHRTTLIQPRMDFVLELLRSAEDL